MLKALIEGEAGIETLSIERPSLHEAFVELVGAQGAAQHAEIEAGGSSRRGGAMSHIWRVAWTIARRDYVAAVFSRLFLIFVLLPLIFAGVGGAFGAVGADRPTATRQRPGAERRGGAAIPASTMRSPPRASACSTGSMASDLPPLVERTGKARAARAATAWSAVRRRSARSAAHRCRRPMRPTNCADR